MRIKRIAFVLYRYPLGVSSMIINSINLFAQKGIKVDIYANRNSLNLAPIEFDHGDISTFIFDDTRQNLLLRAYIHLLHKIDGLASRTFKRLPDSLKMQILFPETARFQRWLKKRLARYDYSCLMPVECRSLLSLSHLTNADRIVYYNMELLDWEESSALYRSKRVLKQMEYDIIRKIGLAVITSPLRADIFCDINGFDRSRAAVLPVTPVGSPITEKGTYFRRLFNVQDDTRVVVYAGSFQPWAKCLEMIDTVRAWPPGYAFVMHTWNSAVLESRYFEEMTRKAKGQPIYFSSEYLDYDKLALALSSADIGLMFYDGSDANYSELLFSSNKLGEYLKGGLPVVCSDLPSLKQFVEEHGIGVASPVERLPQAIRQIGDRLGKYRENALACYQREFRFEEHFERFYSMLPSISES